MNSRWQEATNAVPARTRAPLAMRVVRSAIAPFLPLLLLTDGASAAQGIREPRPADLTIVDQILQNMTVEEKLGQRFIVSFDGEAVRNRPIEKLIQQHHVGNVILFERNFPRMRDPALSRSEYSTIPIEAAKLTDQLQNAVRPLRRDPKVRLPLFIAVDQENGSATIIERGVTVLPGNMALGQTRNTTLAYRSGLITGRELAAMGIHMNLAPVVDVNTNAQNDIIGERTFGGRADLVAPFGVAFMKGLHAGGVVAVGKHFPGHGDSQKNPHEGLPLVKRPRPDFDTTNFPPFRALIQEGVGAIMTAHIHFLDLTTQEGLPVSLDGGILRSVLREELKFSGVIMTDDVQMKAVMEATSTIERAVEAAFEAENDIVMLAQLKSVEGFAEMFKRLATAFQSPAKRKGLDAAVRRILQLKLRTGRPLDAEAWKPQVDEVSRRVGTEEHVESATKIASEAIVALSEKGRPLSNVSKSEYFRSGSGPLGKLAPQATILVVSPIFRVDELTEILQRTGRHQFKPVRIYYGWWTRAAAERELKADLKDELFILRTGFDEERPEDVETAAAKIIEEAGGAAAMVFGVVTRGQGAALERVVGAVRDKLIVAVAFGEPYHLSKSVLDAPNVVSLAAGSHLEPSIEAVVRVLNGQLTPKPIGNITVSLDRQWVDRRGDFGTELVTDKPPKPPNGRPWFEGFVVIISGTVRSPLPAWLGLVYSYLAAMVGAIAWNRVGGGAAGAVVAGDPKLTAEGFGLIRLAAIRAVFGPLLSGVALLYVLIAQPSWYYPDLNRPLSFVVIGCMGGILGDRVMKLLTRWLT